jgi:co-chaperonin GroES (HSP10)
MKPAFEHVLVECIKKQSPSVIVSMEKTNDSEPRYGIVRDVGVGKLNKDKQLVQPSVKVGETVIYTVGQDVKIEGKGFSIVREVDILGVVEE